MFVNLNPDTWSGFFNKFSSSNNERMFSEFVSSDNWKAGNWNEDDWVYELGRVYLSEHTYIEQVFTTGFDDFIVDNSASNLISTGAGNDIIIYSDGSDEIRGRQGSDTVYFQNISFFF